MIGRVYRKILVIVFIVFNPMFKRTVMYDVPRVYFKNRIKLGKKIHINDGVFINAVGRVSIGDYCVLSHGVSIISTKNDPQKWVNRKEDAEIHVDEPIIIESNVWLCANVIVCSGVHVAKDSIVAAGSVVTSNLDEPGCLYGGIPAKKIKKL